MSMLKAKNIKNNIAFVPLLAYNEAILLEVERK